MSSQRKSAILAHLEENRTVFTSRVSSISESEASKSRGPGCWTILEIVEHVGRAEGGMLRLLQSARPVDTSLESAEKEAELSRRIHSRENPASAPERVHPTGEFSSLAAALEAWSGARRATADFVVSWDVDLDFVTAKHPLFGVVSGYQYLLIMAGHAARHLAQIDEIRASA